MLSYLIWKKDKEKELRKKAFKFPTLSYLYSKKK